MNDEFFAEILAHHEKEPDVQIMNSKTSPATAKGDHYASIMFRVQVEYSTRSGKFAKSLIMKTMPEEEGFKKDFLGDAMFFPIEIAMFTEILPKIEAILREAGDQTKLCANSIYHSLKPRQVMVFEDLVPQGYEVIRKRPISWTEIDAALGKLAKWHAVSFKLLKENPEMFEYDVQGHRLYIAGLSDHLCGIHDKRCVWGQRKEEITRTRLFISTLRPLRIPC